MTYLVRIALALVVLAGLNSCGSGAVSGPVPVNDPTRITILPASDSTPVIAYSGLPTVFTISGGTGSYIVGSSNQAVIPISGPINNTQFTVVPNYVTASTSVTITVRDTGTAPTVSVTLTVQPGTVNNNVSVTPTSTQAAACSPAICSGGDALVSVTISQGGIPLAARGVRFTAVTGTFSFVTTVNGVDSLTSTVDVVTDETGKAIARIRIPANAANQSALVQITDLGTGTFQQTSFTIAQATGTSPGFSVLPASVILQGALVGQCAGASNQSGALFTIIGGVPPYTVSSAGSPFTVFPSIVTASGGTFVAKADGECSPAPGTSMIVVDSSGHTATAQIQNLPGTRAAPALVVSPDTVTLTSCTGKASVNVGGGVSNNYSASFGSDVLDVSVSGNILTIDRRNPSPAAPSTATYSVGVTDGTSVATVTVDLVGEGAGQCPPVHANPSSVTLTSCGPQQVTLSGGTAPYFPTSSDPAVTATMTPSGSTTLAIVRTGGSTAFTPTATITITDSGNAGGSVTVNASGTGPGSGTGSCP